MRNIRKSIVTSLVAVAALVAFRGDAALEVYFLRHGETTWNRAKILQGSISYTDLTADGVRMAAETAKGMAVAGVRFGRIYTSPYLRARHTAEVIAEGGVGPAPVADDRLREMCFGKYEGVRYAKGAYPDDNFRCFFEAPERYVPSGAGAETFADVGARLRNFLENELRPLDGKVDRVLCVVHSLVLKSLVREIAGDSAPASAKQTLQRNCCVHVLRYENGAFSLKETGRIFYSPSDFESVKEPKMIAHRGAGDLTMPEASLPAYSNAVAMANDIVKLDLQRTKDGVVVMGHDNSLKRNMGWDVRIRDLTYAEIFEKGRFLDNGKKPGKERIVRLDQALAIVKVIPEFWIDFKDSGNFSPEFAEDVVAAFAAAGIDLSRVMVATFTRPALAYFREHHPAVRRVGHFGGMGKDADSETLVKHVIKFRDNYGLYGVNMPGRDLMTTPEVIDRLRANGLWVSVWFVQNAKTAANYRAHADAFVTDYVSKVRLPAIGR